MCRENCGWVILNCEPEQQLTLDDCNQVNEQQTLLIVVLKALFVVSNANKGTIIVFVIIDHRFNLSWSNFIVSPLCTFTGNANMLY